MHDSACCLPQVDENTIGVVAIFGTTYTGAFADIETLDKLVGVHLSASCFLLGPSEIASDLISAAGVHLQPLRWGFCSNFRACLHTTLVHCTVQKCARACQIDDSLTETTVARWRVRSMLTCDAASAQAKSMIRRAGA